MRRGASLMANGAVTATPPDASGSNGCAPVPHGGVEQSVFNEMGIADHPAMYKILDAVGRLLDEPALPVPPGRQEQQARGEAQRMMHDPEHPDYAAFHNSDDPRFAEVRTKYMRLMGA